MSDHHTLLQTDIVDSTRLAEHLGDAAWAVLAEAHDRVARDLLPTWHGREIDKSDGFLLLFANPVDAVGYALAYHRALEALAGSVSPMRARAGIHLGPLVIREISSVHVERGAKPLEVEGLAKPLTSRVMAVAVGGQTLMTAAAHQAFGGGYRAPTRTRSHGYWQMKGFTEPFELFEVVEPGAPFTPPADSAKGHRVVQRGELWLPKRELRHGLPAERSSFVGRRQSLHELARRFEAGARLVTVAGMGGAGKTRLVQRFGWSWLGDYPGGVWFCDLAQATSLQGVVHAVAQGLDMPLNNADPVAQLGSAIAGRAGCLVILDNFEQVVRHAEATLGHWLDRAVDARFLVTSRESLGVAGEETITLDSLEQTDAVDLFCQRAGAASTGFVASIDNMEAIHSLVRLLEGLPLAIELAAARVRVMDPGTMLARFSERERLFVSHVGRPARHATLRAVLDWSWDLLSTEEKSALAQVTVFEGGFTLPAAEAIVDLSACSDHAVWIPDVLQGLVEKSLVKASSNARFDLFVSVSDYAKQRLRAPDSFPGSGTAIAGAAEARHWDHFGRFGAEALSEQGWKDADNFVAACRRAALQGARSAAVQALNTAWLVLNLRGPFQVGVQLATTVEALGNLAASDRATVHRVAGLAFQALGQRDKARARFAAALSCAVEAEDLLAQAKIHCAIGEQLSLEGDPDAARASLLAALSIASDFNDRRLCYQALNDFGSIAVFTGHWTQAEGYYERALALAQELGDQSLQGGALGNLGTVHYANGRLDLAEDHYSSALKMARRSGNSHWEGNALCNLGMICLDRQAADEALAKFELSLSLARELGDLRLQATVLCNLGIAAELSGNLQGALVHLENAATLAERMGDTRLQGQFAIYRGRLLARRGLHEAASACLDDGESQLRRANDQSNLALLLCARAEASLRSGNAMAADEFLGEARRLTGQHGAPKGSELARAFDEVLKLEAEQRDCD